MRLLIKLLLTGALIFAVAEFSGGSLLSVDGYMAAVWGAVVLGIVNVLVKPIVKLLSLPITILTLGLFSLVVNAFMLYIVAVLVPGLSTVGFLSTMVAALIIAIGSSVITKVVDKDD